MNIRYYFPGTVLKEDNKCKIIYVLGRFSITIVEVEIYLKSILFDILSNRLTFINVLTFLSLEFMTFFPRF